MKRPWLPAVAGLLLGLFALGDTPARSAEGEIDGTALEREAYDLYGQEKYLTARTRAEEALRQSPDSIVGHFVLGSVLRDAEGSLPRSMSHLREAHRLYLRAHAPSGRVTERSPLYRDLLLSLQESAGLMELYDEQLAFLDVFDRLYEPGLTGQHAWPLMKLHRYEEARAAAERALATDFAWQKSVGYNALCAIEAEAHERKASYEQCLAALRHAQKRAAAAAARGSGVVPNLATHAYNAGLGALANLRHDEAERLTLEGTLRTERSASNPWRFLVQLYLDEGRSGDAVAAIRKMLAWCAHQPPGSRDQKAAETDAVTASLLLVTGDTEAGLRFISRAIERPDRHGISSAEPEQALGGHAVIRRALYRLDAERRAESGSARDLLGRHGRVADSLSALGARASALPDDERVVNVLSDGDRLTATLRPYLDGGLDDLPTWLTGDLVDILGAGVVAVALERARRDEAFEGTAPYFDGLGAEVALAQGHPGLARELARSALDKLPPAEALLRARVAAVGAEGARRAGDLPTALAFFQRALELDPGTIRRLGLALPAVVIQDVGGGDHAGAADRAAVLLGRSPRLRSTVGAFEVRVQPAAGGLRVCLFAPLGTSLGCGEAQLDPGESAGAFATRLVDEFHRRVFALNVPITDTDVRGLDGTTTISRDAGREHLRGILDGTGEDDPE
jgi:tetratricopeptide (TPR) repeat protein